MEPNFETNNSHLKVIDELENLKSCIEEVLFKHNIESEVIGIIKGLICDCEMNLIMHVKDIYEACAKAEAIIIDTSQAIKKMRILHNIKVFFS